MAKTLSIVFGVVLVLVGILGYFTNPLVGSQAIFMTTHVQDIVHLVFGVILLLVAFLAAAASSMFMIVIGLIYIVVAILGVIVAPGGTLFNLIMTTMNDFWLYIVLGIVMVIAGFYGNGSAREESASAGMPPSTPTM
ncbi:MAG: DUF4383 domain-containing protein [Candidatus Pacebacteria bacterium]|nr:DUF4383 domain-containing protein [Candidatus Paceibacterota bacterium]